MKLFVLTVYCVAVLATTSGDFERKRELEKVLDELSIALTTGQEANTDEGREEGNKVVGESGTKAGTDAVQDRSVDSINNAREDETVANSIMSHTGENRDDNFEENYLHWLLDAQALADGEEVVDAESNADWDNLFETDIQEMNDGDFDNERLFGSELEEKQASSTASASDDTVQAMSDGPHSEAIKDDDSNDHIQESRDDDQPADLADKEMEEMSLDDEKRDTPDTSDDIETDSFLKMMKATDVDDAIDDNFKDFIDFIQTSDADDASFEGNHLQMSDGDDFMKIMSQMGDSDDTTDADFSEFLDIVESHDVDEDDEEGSDFDSLPDLAHKLSNHHPIKSEEDPLQAKRSDLRKPPIKNIKELKKKSRLLWKILGKKFYYKKYRSLLMKFYRLRRMYFSLKSKCRRVLKAWKKTAFKLASTYCKKGLKKMEYHKVHPSLRG